MMSDTPITIEQHDWQRFLTSDGLAEKAGCSPNRFAYMVIKEFADNAADIGGYTYRIASDEKQIFIHNSGAGLSSGDISKYFSIKRPLRSSKHWRRGERGALGNGIRAALAGCRICKIGLQILSRGFAYKIALQDDGEVEIITTPQETDKEATTILLNFSELIDSTISPFSHPDGFDEKYLETQRITQGQKVTSDKPLPSWFKKEDLNVIVQSLTEDMTLFEFSQQFNLNQSLPKQDINKQVKSIPIKDLMALLSSVQGKTTINPIGKEAYEGKYKKVEGFHEDGEAKIPFTVEAWATAKDAPKDSGHHNISIITNRTPILGTAQLSVNSGRPKFSDNEWSQSHKNQINRNKSYSVTLAVSSPFIPIISSGKMPSLVSSYGREILDALYTTMKSAGAATTKNKSGINLIEAGHICMEEAYNKVSSNGKYWANARQLMYAARPNMLRITGLSSFGDSHFTQTILPLFLQNYPELTASWKVAYDKRGSVIQPHTGRTVGLGTVDIDRMNQQKTLTPMDRISSFRYSEASPERRFGGILFVEKEGFNQAITDSGLLEKHDIALASTKGNSVVALRVLLDEMVSRNSNFKVFTMTDFDISGTSIKTTLTKDNELRYTFRNNIRTIPICVTWPQAEELHDLGLSEPVALDKGLDTENKFEFLVRQNNVDYDGARFLLYDKRRVEINALTTEEILTLIEKAFKKHTQKVLPDREHLVGAWKEQLLAAHLAKAETEMKSKLDLLQVPHGLLSQVEEMLEQDPKLSWDEAVRKIASQTTV
jgi:hypothetical protein